MHTTTPPAAIRLRAGAYDAWATSQRLGSEGAQAERIGVDRTTLNRVRRGEMAPGEKFIAAVLAATGRKFEVMFEVVTEAVG